MKNYKNGFIGIIVAVAVVAVGFLGYGAYRAFHEDKINEGEVNISAGDDFPAGYKPANHVDNIVGNTSDWKSYTNTKYNIQFKYPDEWGNIMEQDVGNILPIIRIAEKDQCSNPFDPKCNTSSEVLISGQKGYTLNSLVSTLKISQSYTNISVGGFPAIFYSFVEGRKSRPNDSEPFGYYKGVRAYLERSDGMYVALAFSSPLFSTESDAKSYNASDFEKFLATVKFTNTSSNTSNWKTYHNSDYEFNIHIPAAWKIDDSLTKSKCCLNIFNSTDPYDGDRLKAGVTKVQFMYFSRQNVTSKNEFIESGLRKQEMEALISDKSTILSLSTKDGSEVLSFKSDIAGHAYFVSKNPDFTEGVQIFAWGDAPEIDDIISSFKFTK